ncbi:MAG: hypothetical protein Q9220_007524 [cf. Caloplaca sp. 1 TL-2023]
MSSKRKAAQVSASATAHSINGQPAKRRKISDSSQETAEDTTETGLRCLERLKSARDKKDWAITTHFLDLPDKEQFPHYYQETGLPMSLNIIEAKLNNHEYPTMTTVESDLRRMILNAKSFNEKSSAIFSDAEKIRKAVSNFMVDNNPAYHSGDYKPFPTPVPEDWQERLPKEKKVEEAESDPKSEVDLSGEGMTTRRASSAATGQSNVRTSATPAVPEIDGIGESFDGDTFQKAQEKIVAEMLELTNEEYVSRSKLSSFVLTVSSSDELIVGPFINLPSRDLRDYYRVIKHPVSLKSVQRAVLGIRGREKPTGVSYFKSWATFAEETSCVWKNAYHYNEDGSDISEAARILEDYFYRRLDEAKKAVAEPPQPKVKLRMPAKSPEPPKITLKFGSSKSSAANGVSVDNEALKRQQDLVNAGMSGEAAARTDPRAPFSGFHPGTKVNGIPPLPRRSQERTRSDSAEKPAINGVKSEASLGQSPALTAAHAERSGPLDTRQSPMPSMMPPPANLTPRLPSGSPHPQSYSANQYGPIGYASTSHSISSRRQPGKGKCFCFQCTDSSLPSAIEALITNLSVSTHPGLKIDTHFHLDLPPSPTTTQHSVTVTLPSTYYYLQLVPTLASNVMHRPYKVFVTVNNTRVIANPQRPEDSDPRKPLYELRVLPGMNRIEVEMVAGMPRGVPKVGSGPELEMEKMTVFAHLVKT